MADLQDAVARGDAGQRDEADHARRPTAAGPASHSAATDPISASGTLPMMISASSRRAVAAVEDREDQRRARPATASPMVRLASSCAWNVPSRLV